MFTKRFLLSRGSSPMACAAIGIGTLAMLGLTIGTASASVVYNDTFARGTATNPENLSGTSPSPTDSNNATWTVVMQNPNDGIWATNGSALLTPSTLGSSGDSDLAYLPLTLSANTAYSFSTTITPTNSTNWLAMGFSNTGIGYQINNSPTEAWLLYRDNGGINAFWGGGTTYGKSGSGGTGAADTFTITLTTNSTLTGAGVTWSDTGGHLTASGTLNASELANINDITVDTDGASGTFQNVQLTATAVPEPAPLSLVAIGGLGLLLLKRRRTV